MGFSCDPYKQAQKGIFTRKISKDDDPPQINSVSEGNSQKQALFSITVYHLRNI